MKNKIWRMKQGRIVDIVNLDDFKQAADLVLPEHFMSRENLREGFNCFFVKAGLEGEGREMLSNLEIPLNYATMEAAEDWLKNIGLLMRQVKGGRYLEDTVNRYIASAKAVIGKEMPEESESRGEAFVYLTLASWVFAQKAEEMKPATVRRLLSCWRSSTRTVRIAGGEKFFLSFDDTGEKPLIRKMLINDSGLCVFFAIIDPQGGEHAVCMPPHTQRLALFAGEGMTCIKGVIADGGDHARARVGNQLLYLEARDGATVRSSGADEELTDYADDLRLSGTTLNIKNGEKPPKGVLAVFKAGTWHALLMEDGTLYANHIRLFGRAAICVLQEGNHLHAVLRGGEVASTAEQPPAAQEILSRMLSRFDAGRFAERVAVSGGAFVMTEGGELRFIKNG